MTKRRALIMYATMTRNTEKVATWFRETFEEYNWDVTFLKIKNNMNWDEWAGKTYFDDYDVVCLGSPIVGGSPLQAIIKAFSFGGGGALEKSVQDKLDAKDGDAAMPAVAAAGSWRRERAAYPGIFNKNCKRPYGIVFSTYGGGFYGSRECSGTLGMLELYLRNYDCDIVGKFACGGKETGPAGYDVGVKPKAEFMPGPRGKDMPDADVCDAVLYEMADGTKRPGSYFFHYNNNQKPGPREEAKARAFIADIVEDYFMTYDGEPFPCFSQVISIS